MENKEKKKQNIFLYFIKMSLTFTLVFFLWNIFFAIIPYAVAESKYSLYFIVEAMFALMVLVVLLLSKNGYVFTGKKVVFFKSLIIGLPILILSLIVFMGNVSELKDFDLFNTIGALLFCMSIGVAEEFLCRGWIQNEFIERFSKTRGQVILSIILSSLIFGFMHMGNVGMGQTLFDTLLQVGQTTALGMLLGSVYFRTKNIWSVVFLHGFYDFAIMIREANVIKDCTTVYSDNSTMIFGVISSIIIMLFWILGSFINLRKDKINPLITGVDATKEEKKKGTITKVVLIVLMFFVFFSLYIVPPSGESICYDYKVKELENSETHYSNYTEFNMISLNKDIYLKLYQNDDGNIVVKNLSTNKEIILDYNYVEDYIVIENNNSYEILIYDADSTNLKVYYTKVFKNEINNEDSYLELLKTRFTSFDVPEIGKLGYLTIRATVYKYPMIQTMHDGHFIIDETDNLYLVNYTN